MSDMEVVYCIFCHTQREDPIVIEENGFTGRQCPQCSLIYVSPRPSSDKIVDLYGHDEAQTSAELLIAKAFLKRLYARHSLSILRQYLRQGTLLEIGAGAGYFLDEARKQGFTVYGIELNSLLAGFTSTRLGIPCEMAMLVDLSDDRKYDVIYLCDVISHYYDPIDEFREIHRRLAENGIVFFETGNFGDVDEKYYPEISKFQYPDHLFLFSRTNLLELLEQTGFKLLAIYEYSILPELRIKNIAKKVLAKIRGTSPEVELRTSTPGEKIQTERAGESIPSKTADIFRYMLRYKLGYVLPKKGRPQTLIVVAQKTKP